MKNSNFLRKITSRKFIVSIITMIMGIVTLIVGENDAVKNIAAAAMTVIPAVVYCIMEGRVDAASVKQITEATVEVAEQLGASEKETDTIEKIGDAVEKAAEAKEDPEHAPQIE